MVPRTSWLKTLRLKINLIQGIGQRKYHTLRIRLLVPNINEHINNTIISNKNFQKKRKITML